LNGERRAPLDKLETTMCHTCTLPSGTHVRRKGGGTRGTRSCDAARIAISRRQKSDHVQDPSPYHSGRSYPQYSADPGRRHDSRVPQASRTRLAVYSLKCRDNVLQPGRSSLRYSNPRSRSPPRPMDVHLLDDSRVDSGCRSILRDSLRAAKACPPGTPGCASADRRAG